VRDERFGVELVAPIPYAAGRRQPASGRSVSIMNSCGAALSDRRTVIQGRRREALEVAPARRPSLLMVATVASTIDAFLVPYAEHFRDAGWRVEAAASGAAELARTGAFDRLHEVPFSRSIRDVRSLLQAYWSIRSVIGQGAFDLVHVHTPIASFLARAAIRLVPATARPRVAYTAHGFHFHSAGGRLSNLVYRTAERIAGRWTDALIVMNDEDEAAAQRHRIVPASRLIRMPGIGIDTDRFSPAAVSDEQVSAARALHRLDPVAPMFLLVAEFTPRKRHVDAIDALGQLRHEAATLVMAGTGPLRQVIEARASASGLGDRVRFAGHVEDVRPLIRAATALILPSDREGLARAVMEALACEVPVVASAARGNPELVGPDAGFVVAVRDVAALAAGMDWLAAHPYEARVMGAAGRRRMVERHDLRRLIGLHDELYASLLVGNLS
jgi:glycosyltransferase involved in cell wall biosynthesis